MDKRIFWLALGSFAISTEGFVISSLLPDIARDAGISIPLAGTLITAFALAYAVGTPILATLTGEWDRRRVILWTLVFFVIGNIAAALSSSFELLLIARIVMALSSGLFRRPRRAPQWRWSMTIIGLAPLPSAEQRWPSPSVRRSALVRDRRLARHVLCDRGGSVHFAILWYRLPRIVGTRLPERRLAAALRPA